MAEGRVDPKAMPLWRRLIEAVLIETAGVHPRLNAYSLASSLLPLRSSGELRTRWLRLVGFEIGEGTRILGPIKISGPRGMKPLRIGRDCSIDCDCVLDLSEQIEIGDSVTIEPGVLILTSTHELDFPKHRAGPLVLSPVTIGAGAWLRARSVILPGVTIGAGAVVEAGAVVNKDVEPNTSVGGIPAIKLETLKTDGT